MEERRGTSAAEFAGVGVQFAASIVVFLFAGQWLDRRFGTSPVFVMIGVFVGGAAAFYSMYRKLTASQRAESDAERDKTRDATRDATQQSQKTHDRGAQ